MCSISEVYSSRLNFVLWLWFRRRRNEGYKLFGYGLKNWLRNEYKWNKRCTGLSRPTKNSYFARVSRVNTKKPHHLNAKRHKTSIALRHITKTRTKKNGWKGLSQCRTHLAIRWSQKYTMAHTGKHRRNVSS